MRQAVRALGVGFLALHEQAIERAVIRLDSNRSWRPPRRQAHNLTRSLVAHAGALGAGEGRPSIPAAWSRGRASAPATRARSTHCAPAFSRSAHAGLHRGFAGERVPVDAHAWVDGRPPRPRSGPAARADQRLRQPRVDRSVVFDPPAQVSGPIARTCGATLLPVIDHAVQAPRLHTDVERVLSPPGPRRPLAHTDIVVAHRRRADGLKSFP